MHRATAWLLVFTSVFVQVVSFSLFDALKSYAKFQRWPAHQTGDERRLSFRFKTNVNAGLIFYVDNNEAKQYLTFYLRDGFLVLDFNDGARMFKAASGMAVNDLLWHSIVMEFSSYRAVLKIDDRSVAEYTTSQLVFKSHVYAGGFPIFMDLDDLVYFEAAYMRRFLGCIESLRYGNNTVHDNAVIVKSVGLSEKCLDACKLKSPCENGGVCVNKFAMAECVCTGTGHTGDTCQKELPVVGIPTSYDRVIIDISSSALSNLQTTTLLIRFRSARQSGVFFYTADKGDFILMELTNGNIATTVNLGSGSVTITTKNGVYNDNEWHTVRLHRVKRMLNLTVDGAMTVKGETKGAFTSFGSSLPNFNVSLGGLPDVLLKQRSVSRSNFTGCLQELIFNDYDLFSKLNVKGSDIRSRTTITESCPNLTTPTVASPSPDVDTPTRNAVPTTRKVNHPPSTAKTTEVTTTSPSDPLCPLGSLCSTTRPLNRSTSSVSSTLSSENTRSSTPSSYSDNQVRSQSDTRATTRLDEERSHGNAIRPTDDVLMAPKNERSASEKDLTLWFILAAGIAIIAFLLAIAIIIKIHATNRKKYKVKESRVVLNDTGGSFQRSTTSSESKGFV